MLDLKFQTLISCKQGLNKQPGPKSDCFIWRSSLIRVFPVCYSDRHFCELQPLYLRTERESVWNFRTFTITCILTYLRSQLQQMSMSLLTKGQPSILWPEFLSAENKYTQQIYIFEVLKIMKIKIMKIISFFLIWYFPNFLSSDLCNSTEPTTLSMIRFSFSWWYLSGHFGW